LTKKFILIIALSTRPFVKAAKEAGYHVTAIDAFADKETVALADKTLVVGIDKNGFVASQLLAAVKSLALDEYAGFVYGSGLDAQPALLQELARLLPLIGNRAESVADVKTATSFFAALDALNIQYPAIYFSKPVDVDAHTYLMKFAGGCGGTHIQICDAGTHNKSSNSAVSNNYYFQQYIAGRSISLLFLASQNIISVIGFNEQLMSASQVTPFRYGGAVSNIELMQAIKKQLIDYAEKLTVKFGLVGLNSLDVIVENDVVYVLEINPRLTATFDLYADSMCGLFTAHLQACQLKNDYVKLVNASNQSNAHAILYAPQAMQVTNTFIWPDWVVDTPQSDQTFINVELDAPICTVLASAETSGSAKQLVQSRVKMLLDMLIHHSLT